MLQRLNFVFVLAGCFQIIIAYVLLTHVWSRIRQVQVHHAYEIHGLPTECAHRPEGTEPGECCELDPFYPIKDIDSCANSVSKQSKDPACDTLLCLMRLRDYVNENNDLLLDRVSVGLDKWASGTVFEQNLPKIKQFCMNEVATLNPASPCEQARFFQCMLYVWTNNCPEEKWVKSENCTTLKKYLQLCSPPL